MSTINYCLFKKGNSVYAIKTCTNPALLDIDILCRFRHPILLGAHQVLANENKLLLVLPPAPLMLSKLLQFKRLFCSERLSLLYSLTCGLKFLHQHHILCHSFSLSSIAVFNHGSGWYPVLTDFSTCSYDFAGRPDNVVNSAPEVKQQQVYSDKSDIWALADIYQEVLTGTLPDYTQSLLSQLLGEMRANLPEERPSAEQLLENPIFEGFATQPARLWPTAPQKAMDISWEPIFLESHKLYITILTVSCQTLFITAPIALLFMTFELYYRATRHLQTCSREEQLTSLIVIIQLAADYLRCTPNQDLLEYFQSKSITPSRDLLVIRNELLQYYGGMLYDMRLYRGCHSLEDLISAYNDILIDRTARLYTIEYIDIHYPLPEKPTDLNGYQIRQMFT